MLLVSYIQCVWLLSYQSLKSPHPTQTTLTCAPQHVNPHAAHAPRSSKAVPDAGHGAHTVSPAAAVNVRFGHGTHADAPAAGTWVPAGHGSHGGQPPA